MRLVKARGVRRLSRNPCQICHAHKWHVKVRTNLERQILRICRFCYADLTRMKIKMVVLRAEVKSST